MKTTDRWKNVKTVCNCRKLITDEDIFYKVGDSICCKKCAAEKPDAVPCMFADNTAMEIINRNRFGSLENGIYRLRAYMGKFLIREKIENADSAKIKELTDSGSYILEKRIEGFILRFHVGNYTRRDFFDLTDYEYEELDNLIDRHGERDLKLICEGEYVIGISVIPRTGVYKNSFVSYDHSFEFADIGNVSSKLYDTRENAVNGRYVKTKEVTKMSINISAKDMLEYFDNRLIGQQTEVRKIVYLFCEYLRNVENGEDFKAPNWVLTAPSGCGKTEIYRILRDYFRDRGIDIPVLQIDLSLFSEAGYKGKEISDIIDSIAAANDKGDGTAIVFLDEADKKFVPSIGSSGLDFNAAAQANLLTLVEGSIHEKKKLRSITQTIDTNKTMFVFMGAFQSIRDNRQKKSTDNCRLGFCANHETKDEYADGFYDDITIDDMIEFGMLEELAGRMEQVINLHRLSENDMRRLITEKVRLVAEETGITIELDEGAVTAFLDVAYTNLGIRSVTNRIKRLVCEKLSSVYFLEDFDRSKCIVWIMSPDLAMVGVEEKDGSYEFTA
ncbi:AAA family ATPase [Ruminococcus sp.]|uniref:AAA family ATPase n=1 Tax=Ruminococcus sp. TaxID=41978 RepID=UPI00258F65EF|nr:AAA family ATPase [Ruminococcus sp.]MCR5021806.1 AAA family ATPase [Ruminococcus sp.]